MDLKFIQIIVLLSCATFSICEVSQQKLTGDESSLSSDTQVTESTLASSGSSGLSRSSASASSSSTTTSSPSPYSFSYNTADVAGTQLVRQEAGDANGAVRGRYGYRDADGLYRTVEYIADANGFRAAIRSNEPGLGNSADANELPASVFLQTEATPSKVASKVASASLNRLRTAQNTLATAAPTTTSTTRIPATVSTTTTSRPSILASLAPSSATKGGAASSVRLSTSRVAPVTAARANTVRQSGRSPSTLRLVSSQVVSLPRLAPTTSTSTTTTTTTTTTEAPATVSEQFLSGQQDDQQFKSSDEQIQSDSLSSDRQLQTEQQLTSNGQQNQKNQQNQRDQQDQQDQEDQEDQQDQLADQQDQLTQVQQVKTVQPVQTVQPAQPVQTVQTVQQKQPDQQTDSSPVQPEVTFTDAEEAEESLPTAPVQPQVQTVQPAPSPPPTTGPVTSEKPLLVRFLDEDLTYDSLEFPHMQPQPRTIAIQTDDHPLSRLYRIVPIPHHESLRLHQAGANMIYLRGAQSDYQSY